MFELSSKSCAPMSITATLPFHLGKYRCTTNRAIPIPNQTINSKRQALATVSMAAASVIDACLGPRNSARHNVS